MKKIYVVSDYCGRYEDLGERIDFDGRTGYVFAYLDDVSKVKPAILNYIKELIGVVENDETKQAVDYEKKRYERLKKMDFLEMDIGVVKFAYHITIQCVELNVLLWGDYCEIHGE